MQILITGSSGFLGRRLVAYLAVEPGISARGFDVVPFPNGDFATTLGDLTDARALTRACEGADAIVHLGGIGDVDLAHADPELAWRANVTGSENIAAAAAATGARLVYASTWEVYGDPHYEPVDELHPCNPPNHYAATKLAGERAVVARDALVYSILRLGTAYGPSMRPNAVIARFIATAHQGNALTVLGSGNQSRQFTHAHDIARAIIRACSVDETPKIANVIAPEQVTIVELAMAIGERFGVPITFSQERAGDPPSARISAEHARRSLGWEPEYTFRQGLDELLEQTPARW